ncbi:MAG: type II toxin-antitoxin system RelE/ParE family toxin [Tardiphaga sp.]
MRLVFDENAARDLENISDWISHDSPSAATNVIQRLKAACTNLPVFPAIGKESFEPGMRELVVTGLPYIIVYTVDRESDQIVVSAILHSAQNRKPE